jgi:hypothetical protein
MSYYREDIAGRLMGDLMSDYGLTREQASGIVANLAYESAGFKTMQEDEPTIPGSRGGYGYAQWTASRRRDFEKFVSDKEWNIDSYQANYGNLRRELDGKYSYVIDQIKEAKTAKQASDIFVNKFERPGPATAKYAKRERMANEILYNPNTGFVAPYSPGKGISQQDDLVRRQMYEPGSGDMGLVERQEPAFHNQFAPGGGGLLGAPQISREGPPGPPRSDYSTGPLDPAPWADSFAPTSQYAPRTAPRSRFDQTFRHRFPTEPQRPPMTPGTSDTARTAAYRGLADTLAQAGVGGLNGQATPRSRDASDDIGSADERMDHSSMPEPTEFDEPNAAQDFTVPTPKPAPPVFATPVPTPAPRNRMDVQVPITVPPPPRSVPIPTPRPRNGQTGDAVLNGRKRVAELLVRRYLSPAGRSMGIEMTSPGRRAVARALLKAQATA